MEVLEAIRSRRTARMPFDDVPVPAGTVRLLEELSGLSPDGGPPAWRLVRIEDRAVKERLAGIVRSEFGTGIQRDARRFRQVFSQYPRWLRFSAAADGIRLVRIPRLMRHFFRLALGPTLGPLFGRLGIMDAEIEEYCTNLTSNPILFGVFLRLRETPGPSFRPITRAGAMLQNLRLAATSLGLRYQDIGWITATRRSAQEARSLLGVPPGWAAVNFFRIGYAPSAPGETKRSDFRRGLPDIVHVGGLGNRTFRIPPAFATSTDVIDAIRGATGAPGAAPGASSALGYVLEAARWAPTGFNVQPFEFVLSERDGATAMTIVEDRRRRDPDPGPCEALARGGVMQNVRLAARAIGDPCDLLPAGSGETPSMAPPLPTTHRVVGAGVLRSVPFREIASASGRRPARAAAGDG